MNALLKILSALLITTLLHTLLLAESDKSPLGEQMAAMNKSYRGLSKAFRGTPDPSKNAEHIAWAQDILKYAQASVKEVPPYAETLPPAQKEKMIAEYKAAMQANVKAFEELISALKAKDYSKAATLMETIKKQKKEGHNKFQED